MPNLDGNEGNNQGFLHDFPHPITLPPSDKMMGENRRGDGEISSGGEAVLDCTCREFRHECRGSHRWHI